MPMLPKINEKELIFEHEEYKFYLDMYDNITISRSGQKELDIPRQVCDGLKRIFEMQERGEA